MHAADSANFFWISTPNRFMDVRFWEGTDPNAPGDMHAETQAFLDVGVDGIFSDNPDIAVDAVQDWLAR